MCAFLPLPPRLQVRYALLPIPIRPPFFFDSKIIEKGSRFASATKNEYSLFYPFFKGLTVLTQDQFQTLTLSDVTFPRLPPAQLPLLHCRRTVNRLQAFDPSVFLSPQINWV